MKTHPDGIEKLSVESLTKLKFNQRLTIISVKNIPIKRLTSQIIQKNQIIIIFSLYLLARS
jgi:hypothetical protein